MICIYFYNDAWRIGSRFSPDGGWLAFGIGSQESNLSWKELTIKTIEEMNINIEDFYKSLDKNIFYSYEICTQDNQVGVIYKHNFLKLIAAVDKSTLKEIDIELINSLTEKANYHIVNSCDEVNDLINNAEAHELEGFVVCDKNFNRMKIPIPTLEEQNKIINKYDLLNDELKILEKLKNIAEKQLLDYFELCLYNNKNNNKIIKFKELINIDYTTGKTFISKNDNNNIYPFYGSNGIIEYVNDYLYDGEYILIGRKGSCGCIHMINCKFNASDTVFIIQINEKIVKTKYMYYLLKLYKHNNIYLFEGKGSVVPGINKEQLNNLNIIIPSIETQNKILEKIKIFEDSSNNYNNNHLQKINELTTKFNELLFKSDVNIDKIIQVDEEVKEVKKSKTKTKSINV
jgi:type I restriction enzyme S subunit